MGCHHSKTHAVAAAASPSKRHPSPIRPGSNDDERRELAARSYSGVEPSRPAVPAKNDATSAAACSRGSIVGVPPDAPMMDGDTVPQSTAATSGDDGGGGGARILLAAAYYANAEECVRAERMKRLAWEKLTARGGGAASRRATEVEQRARVGRACGGRGRRHSAGVAGERTRIHDAERRRRLRYRIGRRVPRGSIRRCHPAGIAGR